ncbi:MAG: hypothetical protein AB7U73_03825 [Pirellulales bacterium]
MIDSFRWLVSKITRRGKALWHYRRGMRHANAKQYAEAIRAYSVAIAIPDGPADVTAMARYNRALVYASTGDEAAAIGDLELVLAMPQRLEAIKTASRQRLHRMTHHVDRGRG